jgi:hypothetical protein
MYLRLGWVVGDVVWLSSIGKGGFCETFAIFFPALTFSLEKAMKTKRRFFHAK